MLPQHYKFEVRVCPQAFTLSLIGLWTPRSEPSVAKTYPHPPPRRQEPLTLHDVYLKTTWPVGFICKNCRQYNFCCHGNNSYTPTCTWFLLSVSVCRCGSGGSVRLSSVRVLLSRMSSCRRENPPRPSREL